MEEKKAMKTLRVGVFCSAYYTTSIEVPADMDLDEAIDYAEDHLDELPIEGDLEYVEGSDDIDRENCELEE